MEQDRRATAAIAGKPARELVVMGSTRVVANGLDAFDGERKVAGHFPPQSPFREDILAACRTKGIDAHFALTGPATRAHVIETDAVRIAVTPARFGTVVLRSTISSQALHVDPHGAWTTSETLLDQVESFLTGGGRTETRLRKVALHADLVGGKIGRETAGRLRNRTRMRLRVEPDVPFTGFHIGTRARPGRAGEKFFNCYNKSVDIERSPTKAYIQDFWRDGGWTEDMGVVWRVEFTFSGPRLAGFEGLTPLWLRGGLDKVYLMRKRRGSAQVQEDPLWRDHLRHLQFHAPWDAIEPARPAMQTPEWLRRQAEGRMKGSLRSLIGLDVLANWGPQEIGTYVHSIVHPTQWDARLADPANTVADDNHLGVLELA